MSTNELDRPTATHCEHLQLRDWMEWPSFEHQITCYSILGNQYISI